MRKRPHIAGLVGGIAVVFPLWMNAALQAAPVPAASAGVANVRGYGVLSQSGGAATAIANVAGAPRRGAEARWAGDERGTVGDVRVSVSARREVDGSEVVGVVRAYDIRLFGGRAVIASVEARIVGHADATTSDAAVEALSVGQVTVDGQVVAAGPGTTVTVPGAGQFTFGAASRDANGLTNLAVISVRADASPGLPPMVVGHFALTTRPGPQTVQGPDAPPAAPAPTALPKADVPSAHQEPGRPDVADVTASPIRVAPAAPATVPARPAAPASSLPAPHLLPGTAPAPPLASTGVRGNVFPVQGSYTYSQDYGAPRAGTGWHHGNDIFAAVGAPIVAVSDGVLSKVGWNSLGGNRLWLTDAGGTSYYYAHLSAYAPSAVDGASVRAGEVIGYVGNTGQAATTPPHLHFELHPGGIDAASVDPHPFLAAWESSASVFTPGQTGLNTGIPAAPDAGAGAVVVGVDVERPQAPAVGDGIARSAG